MNKSYSKIRHIQESNQRLEKRILNEQGQTFPMDGKPHSVGPGMPKNTNSNPTKEVVANLINDIKSNMSSDSLRDAEDLMVIYKKLLTLKGKMVSQGQIPRYIEMDSEEKRQMPSLHYFNKMYSRQPNNKYGMGDPFDFIGRIKQVGDKSVSGSIEKTKDGKYTTPQVKQMIIDLVTKG